MKKLDCSVPGSVNLDSVVGREDVFFTFSGSDEVVLTYEDRKSTKPQREIGKKTETHTRSMYVFMCVVCTKNDGFNDIVCRSLSSLVHCGSKFLSTLLYEVKENTLLLVRDLNDYFPFSNFDLSFPL